MTKRALTKNILIAESEENTIYTIQTQQTPKGSRFRIRREFLGRDKENITPADLWDSDPISFNEVSKQGKWNSSLKDAVASLPAAWVEFLPAKVAPEFAAELWPLFLTASEEWSTEGHANPHFIRWRTLLLGDSPEAAHTEMQAQTSEPETILDLAGEGGGYTIQSMSTPDGQLYRLKSSGMDWDPDTDEECWSTHQGPWHSSIDEVFADLNPNWYRLKPTAVRPDHAAALWKRYLAAIQSTEEASPRNIDLWSEVLLGKRFSPTEAAATFLKAVPLTDWPDRLAHWQPFATRLQAALAQMKEDQFLVVSLKESRRFVQFAAQGAGGMRAEATSNHFLLGMEKLDAKQMRALVKLGWHQPTGTPKEATPELDPDGSSNFFTDVPNPIDFAKLASLAVHTLSEVFGVPHQGLLQYTAFDYAGNSLMLPDLQIKREQRDPALNMAELADRLLAVVRAATEIDDLEFDDDGDILLSPRGKPLYIRLVGQPPMARFFLPLLENVRTTRKLLDCLNQLNLSGGPSRYFVHKRNVCAVCDIPAWPLQADHIATGLARFSASMEGAGAWLTAELATGKGTTPTQVH